MYAAAAPAPGDASDPAALQAAASAAQFAAYGDYEALAGGLGVAPLPAPAPLAPGSDEPAGLKVPEPAWTAPLPAPGPAAAPEISPPAQIPALERALAARELEESAGAPAGAD